MPHLTILDTPDLEALVDMSPVPKHDPSPVRKDRPGEHPPPGLKAYVPSHIDLMDSSPRE
jgi:hypothetical protein